MEILPVSSSNSTAVDPHGTRGTNNGVAASFQQNYQDKDCQGRLLASFQDDAMYEHVGQDTRSQVGKDDKDKQGNDLKISKLNTKSKDNDKGLRSKITHHEGTRLQQR
ncbi:hypothetical protein Tco_0012709 [Tanacetum coccineum]